MILGYVRVSTKEQNLDLQLDALKNVGVEKFYEDKISSIKDRPQADALLEYARAGDTIVVWKFDRIARSLKHLITIVENLKLKEVKFVSVTEQIDTSTPIGQFFLHITGAFAELERNLIIERTNAGLTAARERGRIGGRKKGLSDDAKKKAKAIKAIYEDENNTISIDEMLNLLDIKSKATLYRYLKEENVTLKKDKK